MGDAIVIIAMFGVYVWGWWKLAALMKSRGSRWWLRHPASCVAATFASIGILLIGLGIGLAAPAEGDDGGGMGSVIMGIILLAPLLWAIGSISKAVSTPAPAAVKTASPKPTGEIGQASRVAQVLGQTVAALKGSAEQVKQSYREEAAKQKQKQSEKLAREASLVKKPGNLKFVYEDAQGIVSVRELTQWQDNGKYVNGFCLTAGEIRTFRRDRILEYLSGEELLAQISNHDGDHEPSGFPDSSLELLFTGLSAHEREELENLATDSGMTVRTRVTKRLNILVTGSRAGPSKVAAARAQGCLIFTPSQFRRMVETGEVPA